MSGIRSDPNADGMTQPPPLSQPVADQICIQREVLRQGAFVAVVIVVCAVLIYFGLRGFVRLARRRFQAWRSGSSKRQDSGSEGSDGSDGSDGEEEVVATKVTARKHR